MTTHVSARSVSNPEPSPSRVDVGLLTHTGIGATLLLWVGALVDAIAGSGLDSDTRTMIVSGAVTLVSVILSRGYQAGKLIAAKHGIDLPDDPLGPPR
jgi:putative exporter of polyketide antibiotics